MEFNWGRQHELFQVGNGVIKTPHEEVKFLVKFPHEPIDDHPIKFFPGLTDGIHGTERLTSAYAESNKIALTLSYPRSNHPDYLDDPEGHKVNSSMLVLDAFRSLFPDLQEADGQGHSDGGSNGSRACLENPEQFRTLVVMGSGGLIKDDSVPKITFRAMKNRQTFQRTVGQMITHPAYTFDLAVNTLGYVGKNPIKAKNEAARIASADIRYRFPVMSSIGIPNAALQFYNDTLFPLRLVKESTDDGAIFDLFRVYPHDDATHITPQVHPRTTAAYVLEMTAELVRKREEYEYIKRNVAG